MSRPNRGETIKVTCDGESITGEVTSVMDVPPSPFAETDKETVTTVELLNDDGCFMVELDWPGVTWEVKPMTSHDETHPRKDLDIVRSGDLASCHMLEVQRIAYNLSIPIRDMAKRKAVRFIEDSVAAGTFTIREPGKPIEDLVREIGIDPSAFIAGIAEDVEGEN